MKPRKTVFLLLALTLLLSTAAQAMIVDDGTTCPSSESGWHDWVFISSQEPTCQHGWIETWRCANCGRTYTDEYGEYGSHVFGNPTSVEPTCTEPGVTVSVCVLCGYREELWETAPLGHEYGLDRKEPTCTEDGYQRMVCSRCGDVIRESALPAFGHDPMTVPGKEPTCTEPGLTEGSVCAVCGAVLSPQSEIAALGHAWDSGIVTKEPACTEEGVRTFTCSRCGGARTESIPAKGHSPVALPAKAATCTENGMTEGSKCAVCGAVLVQQSEIPAKGHTPAALPATPPTCTENGLTEGSKCADCGTVLTRQTEIPALGHAWDNGIVTKEATCTAEGVRTFTCSRCGSARTESIPAKGHTPTVIAAVAATCTSGGKTEGSKCSVCGTVLIPQADTAPRGHVWDNGIVTKEATCTAEGVRTFACSRCGEERKEAIPATGHTPTVLAAKAATCTESGLTEGSKCSVCGAVITAQQVIPAKGHTPATMPAAAATCTGSGLTEGSKCAVCGAVITAQKTVPALGHSWDGGKVTAPASCVTKGTVTYTCTRCGAARTEEIPATGQHTYEWQTIQAATCGDDGSRQQVCAVCGGKGDTEAIPATGQHRWEGWRTLAAASCTEVGTEKRACTICRQTETRQVSALGHDWDEGVITKEAGYLVSGEKRIVCRRCGAAETEEIPELEGGEETVFTALNGWNRDAISIPGVDVWGTLSDILGPMEPDGTPLRIVQQPEGGKFSHGGKWTLTLEAAGGTPLYSYQWYRVSSEEEQNAAAGLLNLILWLLGSNASVSPEDMATIPVTYGDMKTIIVHGSGTYYCVVTDEAGDSVTSEQVEVKEKVYIAEQPENTSESPATFSVKAAGGTPPYTYQWYQFRQVMHDEAEPADTTDTIKTGSEDCYYCVVTDADGDDDTSNTVYRIKKLSLYANEDRLDLQVGESKHLIASISGGVYPYKVEWKLGYDEITSSEITDADAAGRYLVKSIVTANAIGEYHCTVTDAVGSTASVSVPTSYPPLNIIQQPEDGHLPENGTYPMKVIVGNGTAPYWYELWEENDFYWFDASPNEEGENTQIYTFDVEYPGKYYIKVRDKDGREGVSRVATVYRYDMLELEDYTKVGYIYSTKDSCTLSVKAKGGEKPYTYEWHEWQSDYPMSSPLYGYSGSFTTMKGEENSSVTVNGPIGLYYCIVRDAVGHEVCTGNIPVEYLGGPYILEQPQDVTLSYVRFPQATLNIEAITSGDLVYTWEKKGKNGWETISHSKTLELKEDKNTTFDTAITGTYRCMLTDTVKKGSVFSNEVEIRMPMTVSVRQIGLEPKIEIIIQGGTGPYNFYVTRVRDKWENDWTGENGYWGHTVVESFYIYPTFFDTTPHYLSMEFPADRYASDFDGYLLFFVEKHRKLPWTYSFSIYGTEGYTHETLKMKYD